MKTLLVAGLRASTMAIALGGVLFAINHGGRPSASAADDEKSALAKFMRKKLEASSQVLEGLAVEDAELIKLGSTELLEMSKSELWNVFLDEDYREFNRDFRSSVRKTYQAANEDNFDNALLQWTDAVKGCVECHKHVRSQRTKLKN